MLRPIREFPFALVSSQSPPTINNEKTHLSGATDESDLASLLSAYNAVLTNSSSPPSPSILINSATCVLYNAGRAFET